MTDAAVIEDVDTFRRRARAWIETNLELLPPPDPNTPTFVRRDFDSEMLVPERALQRKLFGAGFAGITWPKEYGGLGLSGAHEQAFNEEAADYRLPDFGVAGGTTFRVCVQTMIAHCSPEYLRRHVPNVLAGEELWIQFFSESDAGSDLAGIRTTAVKDGDRWILNGSKIWSSGAYYADYGMCLARTDWNVPKHRGLTWFAVKIDKPGVTVQPIRQINGSSEFCQEFFTDVELTDDDVIGEVNHGWAVAQTMLIYERGGGDRAEVGAVKPERQLAPDLVALAKRHAREKEPNVRQLIARAQVNDFVHAELLARVAARSRASGADAGGVASYAKLSAGINVATRARIGVEIGRGSGLVWSEDDSESPTTSLNYLNGRIRAIAGGTNEMQRNGISERVLGLPREPSFDTDRPFAEVVRSASQWGSGKSRARS